MKREEFKAFVAGEIENVVCFAEEHTGRRLPREYCFRWLTRPELYCEDIPEVITQAVYEDENHIRPCVDIVAEDLLEDGRLLIHGSIAGYAPAPFGKNWAGREGPFIYGVGQNLADKLRRA